MKCAIHPEKTASGSCVYCGKLHCENCLVEVNSRNFCRLCLKSGKASLEEKNRQPIIINNSVNSSSQAVSEAVSVSGVSSTEPDKNILRDNAAYCCCLLIIMFLLTNYGHH